MPLKTLHLHLQSKKSFFLQITLYNTIDYDGSNLKKKTKFSS